MKATVQKLTGRRAFFKSFGAAAAGIGAAGLLTDADMEGATQNVNRSSMPSQLKITDLRVAVVERAPMTCPIIRIDTNQGISGYGEVRDGASKVYALMLKSRILGENPCSVDKIFRKIKQFGFHARQGGGVSGVEMACWDLAGKAFGVPVYQMLGGKFRDRVRLYADTTESRDPKVMGQRLKDRMEAKGLTWLKMDLGMDIVSSIPGTVSRPAGAEMEQRGRVMHPFTGIELTDKGISLMSDFVAQVREVIGIEVPLATDHFGHIGLNSCIRLARAMEKHQLAWMEDMIPWQFTDLLKKITDSVDIPILTGEDIYLKEEFAKLVNGKAVDMIHPDLATAGGILETKKIGDLAMEGGVAMAMHFAGSPVSFMANVHCAAATENFMCLEHHSLDIPWWEDMVTGIQKPLNNRGFVTVPDTPGLGVELNEEVIKQHLREPGYFEPTKEWDTERANDRLWS
ncbi:MAG TPA: mandelate racemase/muconate lactonizing enzyme family protein [Acidobacteriota bacterium]|jgi:L-alanine-DL-glutamate epimerase-like enolase superfamily enzyme